MPRFNLNNPTLYDTLENAIIGIDLVSVPSWHINAYLVKKTSWQTFKETFGDNTVITFLDINELINTLESEKKLISPQMLRPVNDPSTILTARKPQLDATIAWFDAVREESLYDIVFSVPPTLMIKPFRRVPEIEDGDTLVEYLQFMIKLLRDMSPNSLSEITSFPYNRILGYFTLT